jgi:hypothetical protein
MPKLDHRMTTETAVSYETQLVLTVLVGQLNVLRAQLSLPPLTGQDVRQLVRQYLKVHPKTSQGG